MLLTHAKIRSTKPAHKPVKLTDSAGLNLDMRPKGTNLWPARYRIAGSENVYAIEEYGDYAPKIGQCPQASLAARALVIEGRPPSP